MVNALDKTEYKREDYKPLSRTSEAFGEERHSMYVFAGNTLPTLHLLRDKFYFQGGWVSFTSTNITHYAYEFTRKY